MLERWPGDPGALSLLAIAGTVIGEPPADAAWPWPASRLSYANAAIAEAVIVIGEKLGRDYLLRNGLRMLGWLLAGETRNGHLSVVPAGEWSRGEGRPAFDQQLQVLVVGVLVDDPCLQRVRPVQRLDVGVGPRPVPQPA